MCLVTMITVGRQKTYPNKMTWLTEHSPIIKNLPKSFPISMNTWRTEEQLNKYTQNLRVFEKFVSKSDPFCLFSKADALYFEFKILGIVISFFFSIWRVIIFWTESVRLSRNFLYQNNDFRKIRKCKTFRFCALNEPERELLTARHFLP